MAFGPRDPYTAGATVTEAAMRGNSPTGSAPRRPPAASATGRLIVEYHTAFLQASEAQEGNEKDHFPRSGEMARSIKILLRPDSPTGPSFSTARRQRSEDLSHLRKTLNPGIPGLPLNIFRRFRAMACLPRGRLAYLGSIQLKATGPFARSSSPTYTLTRRREFRQPKTALPQSLFCRKNRHCSHNRQIPATPWGDWRSGFPSVRMRDRLAGCGAGAQRSRVANRLACCTAVRSRAGPVGSARPVRMDPGHRT